VIVAKVIADAVNEPISLAEAYDHLRVDAVDSDGRPDDTLIESLIKSARMYCENFTGLSLAMKDYEVRLAAFTDTIELPHPPFISLLAGVTITDDVSDNAIDDDLYTIDDYTDQFAVLAPVTSWPTLSTGNTVRIRYRAGYGDESEAYAALPSPIKAAMLLVLGHLYANREASTQQAMITLPLGVESLLRFYRVRLGLA